MSGELPVFTFAEMEAATAKARAEAHTHPARLTQTGPELEPYLAADDARLTALRDTISASIDAHRAGRKTGKAFTQDAALVQFVAEIVDANVLPLLTQIESLQASHEVALAAADAELHAARTGDFMAAQAAAVEAERRRWSSVLASSHAEGKTELATTLLGENLPVQSVIAALKVAPAASSGFAAFMAANAVTVAAGTVTAPPNSDPKAARLAEIASRPRQRV
jgi:hypothetical protein